MHDEMMNVAQQVCLDRTKLGTTHFCGVPMLQIYFNYTMRVQSHSRIIALDYVTGSKFTVLRWEASPLKSVEIKLRVI